MEDTTLIETQEEAQQSGYPAEASREMMDAGVFYGRKKSKTNPKMKQFVIANRGGIEIINLQKTEEAMAAASAFVTEKVRNNGSVLFVATIPAAEATITNLAKKFEMPYVTVRWVGGTLTNFKNITKRVEYMKKLRTDFAAHALDKYTKKERLEMEREMNRLQELVGGLEPMVREPEVVVVIDPVMHDTAVREAIVRKIPVIALANVDANPDAIDYLVPGNDKAKLSIEWFLGKMESAIEEGLKARAAVAAAAKQAAEDAAAKMAAVAGEMKRQK
jgi:small subunit ribosomal protein S2